MKLGAAIASLGLVHEGSAFIPSLNVRHTFAGQTVLSAVRSTTPSERHTRHVLKAVAAAPAVATEVLTRVCGGLFDFMRMLVIPKTVSR